MNILTPITCISKLFTVLGILHSIRKTLIQLTSRDSRLNHQPKFPPFVWFLMSMLAGFFLYSYSQHHSMGRTASRRHCKARRIIMPETKAVDALDDTTNSDEQKRPHQPRENPGI